HHPPGPGMGAARRPTTRAGGRAPGGCHYGSPDKEPAVRLRVLEDAGRSAVPFPSGILVGIGETDAERVDALFALRRIARGYRGIQEVIVQNFLAKPDTAMRSAPDLPFDEYLATVAVARLVLGSGMRIQAPPNLSEPDRLARLLAAGVDDWGGVSPVTPDHVNPERPWPHLDRLTELTAAAGFELRPRLTVHPEYVQRGEPWLDPRIWPHVWALAEPETGRLRAGSRPGGRPRQGVGGGGLVAAGRVDLHVEIDTAGRHADRRTDFAD